MNIEGIYAAYLTAAKGNGLVMLLFRAGRITGVDFGGVKYDGDYQLMDDSYGIRVAVTLPPNLPLAEGGVTGPVEETYELKSVLPTNFTQLPFVRIDGRTGPINTRFVKLRDLDD